MDNKVLQKDFPIKATISTENVCKFWHPNRHTRDSDFSDIAANSKISNVKRIIPDYSNEMEIRKQPPLGAF